VSKKLEAKQARRAAEERRRREQRRAAIRRNLVTGGIATVVVVLVAAAVIAEKTGSGQDLTGVPADEAGCSDIQSSEVEGANHVEDGTNVEYETSPPTSGDHYQAPANPGFYPDPVEDERLVHNFEHGQIVIWYRPNASQETIDQIEEIVDKQQGAQSVALLAVPYEDIESPYTYVLTAWTKSQSCSQVSEAAINEFRSKFQGKTQEAPRIGVPPFNG
jgi:hypothetical protein